MIYRNLSPLCFFFRKKNTMERANIETLKREIIVYDISSNILSSVGTQISAAIYNLE